MPNRVQLEKVRAKIVYRDGGCDDRRGRAQIRPVNGLDRGTVDGPIDVSFATIVLRENTIAAPIKRENVGRGVLSHVSKRQTDTDCRVQAVRVVVDDRFGRNVGDRVFDAVGDLGYD